jgi:hypothetical protein
VTGPIRIYGADFIIPVTTTAKTPSQIRGTNKQKTKTTNAKNTQKSQLVVPGSLVSSNSSRVGPFIDRSDFPVFFGWHYYVMSSAPSKPFNVEH